MSYVLTLDEITEVNLRGELSQREKDRARGVCDYCQRRPTTSPCKFGYRHSDPRIGTSDPCADCDGTGKGDVGRGYCGSCQGKGVAS